MQWNLLVEIGISSPWQGTTTVQRMDRNWWCVILMFECVADGRNAVNQYPELIWFYFLTCEWLWLTYMLCQILVLVIAARKLGVAGAL